MYKKGIFVFSEPGKMLVKGDDIDLQFIGEIDDFSEEDANMLAFVKREECFITGRILDHETALALNKESSIECMVRYRYSQEEEDYIIENKDENPLDYERLQQWKEWCGMVIDSVWDDTDFISMIKEVVVNLIRDYDKSDAVNQFYYQGVPMWLDKDTRAGLKLRFEAEETAGEENTTLWYGVQSFTLPVASAKAMLNAIEMYASACYDKTQEHKAAVMALNTIETVNSYDYTVGYPNKLNF